MATPDFILDLRRKIGHDRLWLPGVTAVVRRDDELLMVQRSDNLRWTPVSGIVDPGEEPAVAARREALEETGVTISVDRLAMTSVSGEHVYDNGDHAVYLDLTFACSWVAGEPYAADDESVDARWWPLDGLPDLDQSMQDRIEAALSDEGAARFNR